MAEIAARIDMPDVRSRQPRRIRWGRVLVYAVLTLGLVQALFPFFWMLSASLMELREVTFGALLPSAPRFMNYVDAWQRANFSLFMWNSLRITGITLIGQLVFCIPAAYAFARIRFFGRDTLFAVMLTTLMIPEVATFIPNYLTTIWLGRLSESVIGLPWLNNWPALTIPFMASAFSVFLLRQFFAQIPNELWEAARIDGAGHVRFLIQIVLPISTAPIMTVSLLTFIGAWNAFLWPLIVTNDDRWRPITVGLYRFSDEAGTQFHLLMAGALITILPILILYFFTQKTFTAGIATTGLKG